MIHLSEPQLLGHEQTYVRDALERRELSWRGSYLPKFEQAFAEFCGVKHALACSSGTAALHLGLLALGVTWGDKVLLPALTYVATANAVKYCNAEPVFCDVERRNWTLDIDEVTTRCASLRENGHRGKIVVCPVHLYGVPAAMGYLRFVQDRYDVRVLEDAAQAHGSTLNGQVVGSIGDLGAFSFFANKLLTCGEGGALTTDDDTLAARVRLLRGQGQDTRFGHYFHSVIGYNYRLTNVQAAIAFGQLQTYDEHVLRQRQVIDAYRHLLGEFEHQHTAPTWLCTVLVPRGADRDAVMARMLEQGVETRPAFAPLTDLPMYRRETPEVSADIGRRGLSLPTHGGLKAHDVERVVGVFQRCL